MTYSTSSSSTDSLDDHHHHHEQQGHHREREQPRICYECGKTSTTQWRRGEGKTTLCNGCGIRYRRRSGREVRRYRKRAASWNTASKSTKYQYRKLSTPTRQSSSSAAWDVISQVSDETSTSEEPLNHRTYTFHYHQQQQDNNLLLSNPMTSTIPTASKTFTTHPAIPHYGPSAESKRISKCWKTTNGTLHMDRTTTYSKRPRFVYLPPIDFKSPKRIRQSPLTNMPGMLTAFIDNPRRKYPM